jgi:hypothetical protein
MPLYYITALHFGFDIKAMLDKEKSRLKNKRGSGGGGG